MSNNFGTGSRFRKTPQGEAGEKQQGVVGNSYPQETSKQDVSLSNIRKAISDEFVTPKARTLEDEPEAKGVYQSSGGNHAVQRTPAPPKKPQRGGDVAHIAYTLQQKHSFLASPPQDEAHSAIAGYIRDVAPKLHDEAPLGSSTARA